MRTIFALLVAAAMAAAAWLFTDRVEIRGLEDVRLAPRGVTVPVEPMSETSTPSADRLRIASIDLNGLDESKAAQGVVLERLADIVREFHLIALQGITSPSDEPVARLAAAAGLDGRKYGRLISPPLGSGRECCAVLFDMQVVEVDHAECYLVNDPHQRLTHDPFVAWFRARGVPTEVAFTFTLVIARADGQRSFEELTALADAFVRVRNDGRGEDDVILVGNLNSDDQNLGPLGDLPRIACAISGTSTTTRGDAQRENLVFDHRATREFTGRAGVYDFLREFNLTLTDALAVSEHLPVWAEFSVFEGGRPRSAAGR
jgi:hypothetical protein